MEHGAGAKEQMATSGDDQTEEVPPVPPTPIMEPQAEEVSPAPPKPVVEPQTEAGAEPQAEKGVDR